MQAKRVTRGELSQSLPRLNGPVHGAAEKLSDGSTSEEKLSDGSTVPSIFPAVRELMPPSPTLHENEIHCPPKVSNFDLIFRCHV